MTYSLGIPSANTRNVSDAATALPSVHTTISSWFRPLILGRVTNKIVEGETKSTVTEQRCRGVIQPFGDRKLRLKPEGERSWNWQMLHVTPDVKLANGEKFRIKGTPYRVMSNQDWSEYGYIAYELVQDYAATQ